MNQIISTEFIKKSNNTYHLKKMNYVFWISVFIIFLFIILYICLKYNSLQKSKIAKNLEYKFQIRNLYSKSLSEYSAEKTSASTVSFQPFIIGLLKIEKIGLMYPILSETSDELLEISPCRFYGPMPNEIGNMCIAGHNYANQTHFAKLHYLTEGDSIQVFDLSSDKIDYIIYSKQEVSADNISCLSQETDGFKEITLVTCNTIKGTRIIIKAKENR